LRVAGDGSITGDVGRVRGAMVAAVLAAGATAAAGVRPPAVAGGFYPADPETARAEARRLLEAAGEQPPAVAAIAPHAGWAFSGRLAARSIRALAAARPDRVILLGPSHRMAFAGAALPAGGLDAFATPLGNLPLDRAALERLRGRPYFDGPAAAHEREHSLEVELPLIREAMGAVRIVPVLVGPRTDRGEARAIARALVPLLGPGTVVLASSDFTHHGKGYGYAPFPRRGLGERLVRLARVTAGRVVAPDPAGFWMQVLASEDTVCGAHPLLVLSELAAHAFEGTGAVGEVTTSGHVTGDWERVVTYVSATFSGRWTAWRDDPPPPRLGRLSATERAALLALARAALETHLGHGPELAEWFAAHRVEGNLAAVAGAFVTLRRRGASAGEDLRACMGSIVGTSPLPEEVVRSAVMAAHDPRFPELTPDELDDVRVEVSVLSPPRRVPGPQAIRLGVHGVVLTKGGHRAVFLPQVATETGWDLPTFLSRLSLKAGLDPGAWRHGARLEVFTAQVFGEGP